MRSRTMVTFGVICAVALLATLEYSGAAPAAGSASKLGIVSIKTVFEKTQHQAQYKAKVYADRSRYRAQLESLSKEIQEAEAELKTRKQGTAEYLAQMQMVLQKRAQIDGQQEYLKQEGLLGDKLWMEKLYQTTLEIINTLAQEKGLDLVLERTEPKFPISSDELMATFSTHKVLYASSAVDLTDEVLSRLDAMDSLVP